MDTSFPHIISRDPQSLVIRVPSEYEDAWAKWAQKEGISYRSRSNHRVVVEGDGSGLDLIGENFLRWTGQLADSAREKAEKSKARSEKVEQGTRAIFQGHGREWRGINVSATIQGDDLVIRGNTFPLKDKLREAIPALKWDALNRCYEAPLSKVGQKKAQSLLDLLDEEERKYIAGREDLDSARERVRKIQEESEAKRKEELSEIQDRVRALIGHGKTWDRVGITIEFRSGVLLISGRGTFEFKDKIKSFLDGATFSSISKRWEARVGTQTLSGLNHLISLLDKKEELAAPPSPVTQAPTCRPNSKSGECYVCGGVVAVGDGCISKKDSSEVDYFGKEDGWVWVVRHRQQSTCDRIIAEEMKKTEELRSKDVAKRALTRKVKTEGRFAPQQSHHPQGRTIDLDRNPSLRLYGGGSWVVIDSPTLWYLEGNGADGDDWSSNNVPGARAWILPYDDESKELIEKVTGQGAPEVNRIASWIYKGAA